jgi:hypothetical protein
MKSTHKGHCQVCGRLQMLPKGKLSKHGYEVRWSTFTGTCWGADHLPFEQDISLIQGAIKRAEMEITGTEREIAQLVSDKNPEMVWVHEYVGASSRAAYQRGDTYMWRQMKRGDVKLEEFGKFSWTQYEHTNARGAFSHKRAQTTVYGENGSSAKSLNEAMTKLNAYFAKVRLEPRVAQLKQYVKWQQERIKGWKPHPEALVAVEA